jgi:hypothetical protein
MSAHNISRLQGTVVQSAYLMCVPVSRAYDMRCYYCDCWLRPNRSGESYQLCSTRTQDHIHLASRGHLSNRYGVVQNLRWSCADCNQWRNRLGHCCGMLMLVLMESRLANLSMASAWMRLDRRVADAKQAARVRRWERLVTRQETIRIALNYGT